MTEFRGHNGNDYIDQFALGLEDWTRILGLAGDDSIVIGTASAEGGAGNDTLVGLNRWSTVTYLDSPSGIVADLQAGWVEDGWGTIDTLSGIGTIQGSSFADTILGSNTQDDIWAGPGDYVNGRAGGDVLIIWQPVSDWSWSMTNSGELQIKHRFSGQVVRAINVEALRFQDHTYLLPAAGGTSQIVFQDSAGLSAQPVSTMVKPLDANGDGLIDLIVANGTFPPAPVQAYLPRLLLQRPDGTFHEAAITGDRTGLVHPRDFATGDFNGDGSTDVLVVGHGYDTVPFPGERSALWLSDGNGGWSDRSDWLPSVPAMTHSVSVADVNQDGIDDIYLGNIWGQQLATPQLLLGGSNGLRAGALPELAGALALNAPGATPVGSLLHDMDGDGFIDLVAGEGVAGTMIFWGKNGASDGLWFQKNPAVLSPGRFGADGQTVTVNIITTDVNNDGRSDILLSQTRGNPSYADRAIQILVQGNNRTFSDETAKRLPDFEKKANWLVFLSAMDLNGDGFKDILGSTQEYGLSSGTMAWLNDGHGVFWEATELRGYPSTSYGIPVFAGSNAIYAVTTSDTGAIGVTRMDFASLPSNRVAGGPGLDAHLVEGDYASFHVESWGTGWRVWSKQSDGTSPLLLEDIERLRFSDMAVALDINGNAGQVARTLGAVFGAASVGNAEYAGIGLSLLDGGMDDVALMQLALQAKLGQGASHAAVVDLLYSNVVGTAPTQVDRDFYRELLGSGSFTPASLGVLAAETSLNAANIDLVGLSQSGLAYWST